MTPINILNKGVYWPICRVYSRYLGDRPADALLRFLCSFQFFMVHRFWPNFLSPQRFSEKVWSRMLHDRNPRLTTINDKLQMREYVSGKVGEKYLVPILWQGKNPEEIPFDELPEKFVIKTNHGSAYVILVEDKMQLDQKRIRQKLKKWLDENFCQETALGIAWGYKHINPTIFIEEFIGENGKVPVDYKFYCFCGQVEVVTIHFDRFIEHKTKTFDRNFEPREFSYDFKQWGGEFQRPASWYAMVRLAESLAEGFDFIRVDLYTSENRIFFGELTPYPGGIATKFLPASEDHLLGRKWGKEL